jgi:hypothetical protein
VNDNHPQEEMAGMVAAETGDCNEQLIEAFEAELTRLREADSLERSVLYEKAAELGGLIIKGQSR